MTIDIHCAGGCGTVLGSVEVENEEDFKGDAYYQNYCDDCKKPNQEPTEEAPIEETPTEEAPIEEQPIIE